jgi:hypothetical protein
VGCGKKKKDDDGDDTTTTSIGGGGGSMHAGLPDLSTGQAVVGYALSALSSATPTATSLALDDAQSSEFPDCSENGAPWDTATGQRMQPSNAEFGKRTFECQLKAHKSPESVRGAFEQNYHILCQIEKALGGAPEYTPEGNATTIDIALSADCGWDQSTIDEVAAQTGPAGFAATVTATSYATGDWQKSLALGSDFVKFTMYITATDSLIAFKQVEHWTQAERDGGDQNQFLAHDAAGTAGGVVALDLDQGILRAEIGDPYWGRRARMFVKGILAPATGQFLSITEGSGLQGNFDLASGSGSTGLYGEVASVKGTEGGGFKFKTGRYACESSTQCDATSAVRAKATVTNGEACDPTAGCAAESGIALGTEAADYDFWMIGAVWNAQGGHATAWSSWLETAGVPTFAAADKTPVLP